MRAARGLLAGGAGLAAGALAILAGARFGADMMAPGGALAVLAAAIAVARRPPAARPDPGLTAGGAAGIVLAAPLAGTALGPVGVALLGAALFAVGGWGSGARVAGVAGGVALAALGWIAPPSAPDPAAVAALAARPADGVERIESRLDAHGRTDVFRVPPDEVAWTFDDGGAPVAVPDEGADPTRLAARFPLEALALSTSRPRRLLSIGPHPGPEIAMASAVGVARAETMSSHDPRVDPRRALREGGPVDLAVLRLAPLDDGRPPVHRATDTRLVTREALDALRDRIAPGGRLAIVGADERLVVRTLLAAVESFLAAGRGPAPPVAGRAWIVRTDPEVVLPGTPRFLALLAADGVDADDATRMIGLSRPLSVRVLAGPGWTARPRYASLAHASTVDAARDALRIELSRRAGEWVELSAPTDGSGDLFRLDRDPPAPARWGLAAAALAILGVALLVLPARRRPDAPTPGAPVPVRLAPALLGGAIAGLLAAHVAAHGLAGPVERGGLLAAGWIGWRAARRRPPDARLLLGMLLPALVLITPVAALWAWPLGPDAPVPPELRPLALALVGLVLGWLAGGAAAHVVRANARDLPGLAPWTRITAGLGLLAGALLAAWLEGTPGPRLVEWYAAAAIVLAAASAVWVVPIRRRRRA